MSFPLAPDPQRYICRSKGEGEIPLLPLVYMEQIFVHKLFAQQMVPPAHEGSRSQALVCMVAKNLYHWRTTRASGLLKLSDKYRPEQTEDF